MVEIAYSDRYIYELPEGHRFPIAKYKRIVEKLLEDKIIAHQQVFDPGMANNEIQLAHDIEYYNKVIQLSLTAAEIRTLGVPLHQASVNRALNSVAGTLRSAVKAARKEEINEKAGKEIKKIDPEFNTDQKLMAGPEPKVDSVLKIEPESKANPELKVAFEMNSVQEMITGTEEKTGTEKKAGTAEKTGTEEKRARLNAKKEDPGWNETRPGISIGGGYHHAFYDHGEGFCIFNDLAITARYLINSGLAKRILIIDLDVHQGNGTASILNRDDYIFTFSMHGSNNYPAKKQLSDYDLDLPDGAGDKDYHYNLEYALDSILKQYIHDYILNQGGVDILQSDQLGRLGLTMKGCKRRDEIVFKTIRSLNIPSTLTLGGGYSKDINVIIQAHVNTIITALDILG
jgi:acetoin utilization deacetylase AcuC-like enzyme